jgi:hypothetical protein
MARVGDSGELSFDEPGRVEKYLEQMDKPGLLLEVTIKHHQPKRSLAQNRTIWGMYRDGISQLSDHTGITEEDMHEYLRDRFCPETEYEVFGEVKRGRSTRRLSVKQASDYIEQCMAFFAQHGIVIHGEVA